MARPISENTAILWLRNDLRLADNPALDAAANGGLPLHVVYIHNENALEPRPPGSAQKWWLHQSLKSLGQALAIRGNHLSIIVDDPLDWFERIASTDNISCLYLNAAIDPAQDAIDHRIVALLKNSAIRTRSFQANLLHDPDRLKTRVGNAFKVFTPFWQALRQQISVREPLPAPAFASANSPLPGEVPLDALKLLPDTPDWSKPIAENWEPGEIAAHDRFETFVNTMLGDYQHGRDWPGTDKTSRMSPYLRFGVVSPHQLWHRTLVALEQDVASQANGECFLKELAWREFSYHLLWHHPQMARVNTNSQFDYFPWQYNDRLYNAWAKGNTGYPIIDAGMRQLWQTGWMHNRVRMITASFLVKHLLVHWQQGEEWFWDTLIDGDPASNPASWQWVAGSGADAAPYFRIFNPVLQSKKFDPSGSYIRHYLPELDHLDKRQIHLPTSQAIIGLDEGRKRALLAYETMKSAGKSTGKSAGKSIGR